MVACQKASVIVCFGLRQNPIATNFYARKNVERYLKKNSFRNKKVLKLCKSFLNNSPNGRK